MHRNRRRVGHIHQRATRLLVILVAMTVFGAIAGGWGGDTDTSSLRSTGSVPSRVLSTAVGADLCS